LRERAKSAHSLNSAPKSFKSARYVQRFVSIYDPIANLFHFPHNQLTAADYRAARAQAFEDWTEITGALLAA
jgi:putative transposase